MVRDDGLTRTPMRDSSTVTYDSPFLQRMRSSCTGRYSPLLAAMPAVVMLLAVQEKKVGL